MYYVFRAGLVGWHNTVLQAEVQGAPPSIELQHQWWNRTESLGGLVPKFVFAIREKAPRLDNYFTGLHLSLFSMRLIRVFTEYEVRHETFPVSVIDKKTRLSLDTDYCLFHLQEMKSSQEFKATATANSGAPIFRIQERPDIVIAHENFVARLQSEEITGCNYIPVSKYFAPVSP